MCDWVVIQLGVAGRIHRIRVDTNHFKGNFPESCVIEGCYAPAVAADVDRAVEVFADGTGAAAQVVWRPLVNRVKLGANAEVDFEVDATGQAQPVTHVRLTIYPDGGVSRLRLRGVPL